MPLLRPDGSEAISPTAHYTGFVWARNGLSPPGLATLEGRVLFESLRAPMAVNDLLGGGTLEAYLLARHRAIDAVLERAIERRRIGQVIEVAAGMSGRGVRFAERYGDRLLYVEADLPAMAERKRQALARLDALSERHRVEDLDALLDSGSRSLPELVRRLDHSRGLVIITEGLLGYLEYSAVRALWRRFAAALCTFKEGTYISDIHVDEVENLRVKAFRLALAAFVRGPVHVHFGEEPKVVGALTQAGFASAEIYRAHQLAG
ncbi:MAG: class I SAM-dependent methyltransferase, partial [Solirubrobacteraceae bacterium]